MSEQEKSDWPSSLWTIFFLVLFIGLLVAVAIPNRLRSGTIPANACINNLRQIDGAAQQLALEKHLTNGCRIDYPSDLTNYIRTPNGKNILHCPSGGIYQIDMVGKSPTCSLGTNVTPAHVLQ
jgi:hypothetical protein